MSAGVSIAEIMQDKDALASACLELAEHLETAVGRFDEPALKEHGTGFLRLLPLMCVFPSPAWMKAFAAILRRKARRLDALPGSEEELARVMGGNAADFAAFDRVLFGEDAGHD
ncbi:MAG: hypothetical protein U1A53_10435 [Prosthecobacter sp.]|nr:hypothetical protein [Prosthecobacter sp.]